jgi:hypothetical protein
VCPSPPTLSLKVVVVVYDGLEWVLGWRQLGVTAISVILRTDRARIQWKDLQRSFGAYLGCVVEATDCKCGAALITAILTNELDTWISSCSLAVSGL